MDALSIIAIIVLLVLILAVFAVLLPIAFIFSFRTGMAYREQLAERIDKLRLGKMLSALGIDIDAYLSRERKVEIEEQMTRCQACENTEACDEALNNIRVSSDTIGFCNNEESLRKLASAESGAS